MQGEARVQAATVLLLGDQRLRKPSTPIRDFSARGFKLDQRRLHSTLVQFREKYGFGRAISAPQIGIHRRFVAMDLGDGPRLIVNPEVTWTSDETFTMWDDCMSFPGLLVRLRRAASISVRYRDERGDAQEWEHVERAVAELLQHELDHLDGVLAIDRAVDRESLVLREVFESQRAHFSGLADYVIGG